MAKATYQGYSRSRNRPATIADQAHDRADREIDAAGDDHQRHADRHDAEGREVARDVADVVRGAEGRLRSIMNTISTKQRHRHPEGLAARTAFFSGVCSLCADDLVRPAAWLGFDG